jgi:hypothetical protein
VRAVSLMTTRSGTIKPVARWWLEGYHEGAHDDEGSQPNYLCQPNDARWSSGELPKQTVALALKARWRVQIRNSGSAADEMERGKDERLRHSPAK